MTRTTLAAMVLISLTVATHGADSVTMGRSSLEVRKTAERPSKSLLMSQRPRLGPYEWIEPGSNAAVRTWTSTQGTTIEARLVKFNSQMVILAGQDDQTFQIRRGELSADDGKHLDAIQAAKLEQLTADWEERTGLFLKAGDQIVAIGDSITHAGGYLRIMDSVFAKACPELNIPPIINVGISGQKAEDLVARFDRDVIQKKPDMVMISIGINDVWHRLEAPHNPEVLKNYKVNITRMVDAAQAAGIRVVLCTPTVIQEDLSTEGNQRLPMYSDAIKAVAANKECALADLHAIFVKAIEHKSANQPGNAFTTDGVHMKPAGDWMMAEGILKALGVSPKKIAAAKP